MSRLSLNRRMMALLDRAERHDPHAVRIYRMPPAVRLAYDQWRARCEAEAAKHPEPGSLFEAYLSGTYRSPEAPRAVRDALAIEAPPVLTDDLSVADVAELYARMIGD